MASRARDACPSESRRQPAACPLDYWRYRLMTGLPSQITEREQAALLAWLRIPGIDFPAAVDLFVRSSILAHDGNGQ
jgi:hypothetical protein